MFKKYSPTLIAIMLLVSLVSCGTVNQPTSSSEANTPQGNSSSTITGTVPGDNYQMLPYISGSVADLKLDASADGSTQQLKVGQVMSISLETNPSTGYSWYATSSNPEVIARMGEPEILEPTASSTPIVGAPTTGTFFFQALKAGGATIILDYKRGWEQDVTPVQTITIKVEVK